MTFSTDELQMIERLRKRESRLRRGRWPLVIICGSMAIASMVILVWLVSLPAADPTETTARVMLLAFFFPIFLGYFLFCVYGIIYVVTRWRGDAKTQLLLKIADELQRHDV